MFGGPWKHQWAASSVAASRGLGESLAVSLPKWADSSGLVPNFLLRTSPGESMELLGQAIISGVVLEDGSSSGGVCTTKVEVGGMGVYALLMLWELRNEIGTGGCDPSVQASFSFTRWWSDNRVSS